LGFKGAATGFVCLTGGKRKFCGVGGGEGGGFFGFGRHVKRKGSVFGWTPTQPKAPPPFFLGGKRAPASPRFLLRLCLGNGGRRPWGGCSSPGGVGGANNQGQKFLFENKKKKKKKGGLGKKFVIFVDENFLVLWELKRKAPALSRGKFWTPKQNPGTTRAPQLVSWETAPPLGAPCIMVFGFFFFGVFG